MKSGGDQGDGAWVQITDYDPARGWLDGGQTEGRAQWCCEQLEDGRILYFNGIPYDFPSADRQFLLQQRQSGSRIHKNISYRPRQDKLRGSGADRPEDIRRLHQIMRHFSEEATALLSRLLKPYAPHWSLDFASFRPEEESGRRLSLHKRNDLLHVDAFPTRPTRGARILRFFTNINPTQPRNWLTTDGFPLLAQKFAREAGLDEIARSEPSRGSWLNQFKRAVGMKTVERSAYDKFMLRFHDYLKENSGFQEGCRKVPISFPPMTTWMCFTDSVPHAVLSGQYALEQTFIIPMRALIVPEKSPLRVLEKMAGRPLLREAA